MYKTHFYLKRFKISKKIYKKFCVQSWCCSGPKNIHYVMDRLGEKMAVNETKSGGRLQSPSVGLCIFCRIFFLFSGQIKPSSSALQHKISRDACVFYLGRKTWHENYFQRTVVLFAILVVWRRRFSCYIFLAKFSFVVDRVNHPFATASDIVLIWAGFSSFLCTDMRTKKQKTFCSFHCDRSSVGLY